MQQSSSASTGYNQPAETRSNMKERCLLQRKATGFGIGTVTFRPVEVKLNKDKDLASKMDPYCKFKIGFHSGKSSVASGQGMNPHWDEAIALKTKNNDYAKIIVKDKDRVAFNERIGFAKIQLESLYQMGRSSQWVPLTKGNDLAGEILVEMEYLPKTT